MIEANAITDSFSELSLPIEVLEDVSSMVNSGFVVFLSSFLAQIDDFTLARLTASLQSPSFIFALVSCDKMPDNLYSASHLPKLVYVPQNPECADTWTNLNQLFKDDDTAWLIPEDFSISHIPLRFDSQIYIYSIENQLNITLSEIYGYKGIVQTSQIGRWTAEHGLVLDEPFIWQRRKDLMGVTLLDSAFPWPPMSTPSPENTPSGMMGDILNILGEKLNFTVTMIDPDGKSDWGNPRDDGSWTGFVGQLMDGRVDVSSSGLSMLPSRVDVIDFTQPVADEKVTLGVFEISLEEESAKVFGFLQFVNVFPWNTWASLAGVLILATSLMYFLPYEKDSPSSWWHTLVSISRSEAPKCLATVAVSSKLALYSTLIVTFGLFVIYTCDITAQMTDRRPITLKSFKDVWEKNFYIYISHESIYGKVLTHYPFTEYVEKVGKTRIIYDCTSQGICNNYIGLSEAVVAGKKGAIFATAFSNRAHTNLTFLHSFEDSVNFHAAFGLPKNSELTGLFDYYLHFIRRAGLISKLWNKWMEDDQPTAFVAAEQNQNSSVRPINISDIMALFIIVVVGMVSGGFLCAWECFYGCHIFRRWCFCQ